MPHHIHSLFHINGKTCISDIMRDFKKYTSFEVRDYLNKTKSAFYPILATEGRKVGQKFKLWMDRSDKVVIVTEKVLTTKLKYIHENPVRAGLVQKAEDYLYSSAKDYLTNDK
ncbi:MAG: transposase [Candidatus Marinimicrobia bacterium]|nr:transposase [bacterium]MCG2716218.1 transposase [Candidatus Neomarinimicrobiota bacterium]